MSYDQRRTIADITLRVYLGGMGFVAATMLIGNAYHGHRMAQRTLCNYKRENGIFTGIFKAMVYSPFSWGFVCYALYRHLFRYSIRTIDLMEGASYPSSTLVGHMRMHIVPNANQTIQNSFYDSDHKYLTQLGIIEPMKTD